MNYYLVEPEVAGGMGKNTVFERAPGKGTVVHKLHYEFDGWLGDVLLTGAGCFIVTELMAREIERAGLSGACFDQVEVTTSGEFQDAHPNRYLPKFCWLKVVGRPGHDDFGLSADMRLVVSSRALQALNDLGISNASVTSLGGRESGRL